MAEQTETAAAPSNGTSNGAGRMDRAAMLASLEKLDAEVPSEPAASEPPADAPAAAPDEDAEPVEAAADDEADEAPAADPDTAKRLSAVQKAEARWREQAKQDRAELKAEVARERQQIEAQWAARVQKAQEFEKLAARAKHDPVGVLRSLGLTDDDLEPAARAAYAESKAGAAKPENREHAARILKERETAERIARVEKQNADLLAKLEQRDQHAAAQAEANRYAADLENYAAKAHPLVAHMLTSDPDEAHEGLTRAYEQLRKANDGDAPEPDEVVAAYDKAQRAKFARLGIDPDSIAKNRAANDNATTAKPSKSLGGNLGGTTKPAAPGPTLTAEQKRAQRIRDLEKLEAGD